MIYCPTDTAWREEQARRYAALLQRVDRGRRVSLAWRIARYAGMALVLGAFGMVFAYALVGGL